jgi:hypothetical protein
MTKIKNIILFIDGENSVCNFWRGTGVFNELERQGYIRTEISNWNESLITLRKYDIAYFQRPMFSGCLQQVLMAKDCGLKIWVDLDDWRLLPDRHPMKNVYDKRFDLEVFRKIMNVADIITVTNEKMKKYYLCFNKNIIVIPNAINDYVFKQNGRSTNNVILWRGGENHVNDIIPEADSIKKFLFSNEGWKFVTIGDRISEFGGIKNHQYVGRFSMHDYFGFMLQLSPAIVIGPLEKNKFNELKSNILWQEATISGAVCVSPSYSTCTDAIQYNGHIHEKLDQITKNRTLIDQNFKKSVKTLRRYYLSKINELRLNIIRSL